MAARPKGKTDLSEQPDHAGWNSGGENLLHIDYLEEIGAPYNPRKPMADGPFEQLLASMTELGVFAPLIVNRRSEETGWPEETEPCLVGGHQRVRAARELGMEWVPVWWVDLDADREKKANLAHNKISGEFDKAKVAELVVDFKARGISINGTGFSEVEVGKLATEIDFAPTGDGTVHGFDRKKQIACPNCGHHFDVSA